MTAIPSRGAWGSLFGRFAAMAVVTVFAAAVMLASGTRWFLPLFSSTSAETDEEPVVAPPPVPVSIEVANRETIELVNSYSGMVQPLERFSLAFEISGRIDHLGKDDEGRELDEGARVSAGQLLAKLDSRAAEAMLQEAQARHAQKLDDLQRSEELLRRNAAGVSESQLALRRSDVAIAQAQLDLAEKTLEDSSLLAPVDGVISKRYLKSGESVNVHQPVFELMQVDQVLLVVGVPEARIGPIIARYREVQRLKSAAKSSYTADAPPAGDSDPATLAEDEFHVYVDLIGQDSLGRQWDTMIGRVHAVGQASDDQSGLFEVEILLDNPGRLIRPGRIGMSHLVVKAVDAFRLPAPATVVQDGQLYIYSLKPAETPVRFLFWEFGQEQEFEAQRLNLTPGSYVEQGDELVVFDLPEEHRMVVVRGQHRLLPGANPRRQCDSAPSAEFDTPDGNRRFATGKVASAWLARRAPPLAAPRESAAPLACGERLFAILSHDFPTLDGVA